MRWLRWTLIVLVVVVVGAGIYGFFLTRRSFPEVDGEIALTGLESEVQVIRDTDGVPHIYADNSHDLFFAQGYVTAQDRFWQMDFYRHIGSGRLSEMLGGSQVETDKFLRSLGLVGLAETEFETADDFTRNVLEWYADGVNAYLATHSGAEVSLEYAVLALQNPSYEIEPWAPVHTLTWAKMMSWDLSGNLTDELARTFLSISMPLERVEQLYPEYPADHPPIVPSDQVTASAAAVAPIPDGAVPALVSAARSAQAVWNLTGGGFKGIGSNNWVIGGDLTETGMPILANDPHLGHQLPSVWYQVGLHCDGADCVQDKVGFTFPGAPGIITGHNEHIAWGLSTQAIDTQDLYIEKVNPDDPNQYEVDGQWVDMETHTETIEIGGGETEDFEVRWTRHGPVISGLLFDHEDQIEGSFLDVPEEYVVALSWQTLEPSTLFEAVIGINEATNYEEFRQAVSLWDIAAQNVGYADIEGNIAYQSTGEIPIRANGDGRYPVPGWTSEYEWTGIVPFESMPAMLNPPQGFVESANQRVTAEGSGPFEGYDGAPGHRAARIVELIQASDSHGVSSLQEMQMDNHNGGAADLVPYLLDVGASTGEAGIILEKLREFVDDGYQTSGDSGAAAAYNAVYRHLVLGTFYDELPGDFEDQYSIRMAGGNLWLVLADLMEDPGDPWWDDVGTDVVESRDDVIRRAIDDAYVELRDLLGPGIDRWSWGRLHVGHFESPTLGQSGIAPIEWLFNRTAPERLGGGYSLINANGWRPEEGYELTWVPSYRMVIDLGDLASSTWINTTGASGHAFHSHYSDQIEPWVDGEQHPMWWTEEQVQTDAVSTLTLIPG